MNSPDRLAHIPAHTSVYIRCIGYGQPFHRLSSSSRPPARYSFCLPEERRTRSHDWRQDITVPPELVLLSRFCRTDRSTDPADSVPAFYDRTLFQTRVWLLFLHFYQSAFALRAFAAITTAAAGRLQPARFTEKQQVNAAAIPRYSSNCPTFFSPILPCHSQINCRSLGLVSLMSRH